VVSTNRDETTALLNLWAGGCGESADRLLERLYPDLHRLAAREKLSSGMEVQHSDLVQELCIRLLEQRTPAWSNRGHFFAVAARLIRRIVIDEARWRGRQKRGSGQRTVGLHDLEISAPGLDFDLMDLDHALDTLSRVSPAAVRVVELRYFAGLSLDETAATLDVGRTTVVRLWRYARAWLHATLQGELRELPGPGPSSEMGHALDGAESLSR
jgi:RNA polymerase sigma factor (TIGR02999 family)